MAKPCGLRKSDTDPTPAMSHSFSIDDDIVVVEGWTGEMIFTDRDLLNVYRRVVKMLEDSAVNGEQAIELIEKVRARYEASR